MFNSIVKGFGFTIGRRAADNMIENLAQSSGEYKESPSLSGKQIFKTIMWAFPMMMLAGLITAFLLGGKVVQEQNWYIPFLLMTSFFKLDIGKGYYYDKKKVIQNVNNYNKILEEKERLIQETEEKYISEKITKREYEVLMRKINKM